MQKLLPIIVILVAAIAGGGGGYFFKMQSASKTSNDSSAEQIASDGDVSHGKKNDADHGKKKKKGGHGDSEEGKSSTTFMKFGRQFVVPVIKHGQPKSMVILDINIEIDSSMDEAVYTFEPRLRDALLSKLLELAADDMLPQILENGEKMEATKQALLETSRTIIGDSARSVLILDIGMQNY
ncbi:hypothetical protein ABFZ85_14525 [Hyphococcus formosus]|uniref:hypothetical protein n=1 Tax=Hyphococcus formosus TaxID=3143534 RepID=UPI00398A593B